MDVSIQQEILLQHESQSIALPLISVDNRSDRECFNEFSRYRRSDYRTQPIRLSVLCLINPPVLKEIASSDSILDSVLDLIDLSIEKNDLLRYQLHSTGTEFKLPW